jgi:hypothetical protein
MEQSKGNSAEQSTSDSRPVEIEPTSDCDDEQLVHSTEDTVTTPEQSQMLNPKRAKSFDVKLMRSAKPRLTNDGEPPSIPVKRQHSEPAANKLDVLRKSFYQRTNSVKS